MTRQISIAANAVTGSPSMRTPELQRNGGSLTERAPISVFLVDDVPELRELIKFGMEDDPGFEVVGEAGDGRSALEGIAETQPAAVLLDLSMPDMNGLEAILEIRKGDPDVAIIVLSGFSADRMGAPRSSAGRTATSRRGPRCRSCARRSGPRSRRDGATRNPAAAGSERGTQDSNLESPVLETGALANWPVPQRGES